MKRMHDMQNTITYNRKNKNIEYIYYQNATSSYPTHTHAVHHTFGIISDGAVCIILNGEKETYRAGQYFYIPPDTPHAIETVEDEMYSMVCVCVPADELEERNSMEAYDIKRLKKLILDTPENALFIKDMAESLCVSPYHMIRQFKTICGLTPHQFQIQCRIRKGQKLLEEGKSVTEAAYATGFCDQSHFDRCFRRIVRLTPSEYRLSVKV